MESRMQCPVCTLYLHGGISMESHLDTHPKDQVIKALCSFSARSNGSSRTPTPLHSERSYRSRSRTPANDDTARWMDSQRSNDNERYWRRTPTWSRSTTMTNMSRNGTPDIRIGENNFDNNSINTGQYTDGSYMIKSDKTQQTHLTNNPSGADFDPQCSYYPDPSEEREIKYSRSSEYTGFVNTNNQFTYNIPPVATNVKMPPTLPTNTRRANDLVKILPKPSNLPKILPKPNNIVVKTNVGGMQYIAPSVKPVHMMINTTPAFVQKSVQNNMFMTGNLPNTQILNTKTVPQTISTNQFNQFTSAPFTPGTTVVTQNSQIIYREMVHNLDGKPFISSMPAVLGGHENVTNIAQSSSIYQNVMVVDQFGNTSCMYATPQPVLHKPCNTPMYNDNSHAHLSEIIDKSLIMEVSPIVPSAPVGVCEPIPGCSMSSQSSVTHQISKKLPDKVEPRNDTPGPTKGLKILSNIKVEVPVQHHKSMINTVMDLTKSGNDGQYLQRPMSPDKILPDLEDNNHSMSEDTQPSTASNDSLVSQTFSVIKNVGNPPSYKESSSKSSIVSNKIEAEFSDSCPVPDLICNEKPSISPCSELSEHCDNSTDRTSISPKPESSQNNLENSNENERKSPVRPCKSYSLTLNNIYVKKNKKILQIKNAKSFPSTSTSNMSEIEPKPSSSTCRSPENFSMNKIHDTDNDNKSNILHTISIEKIDEPPDVFDADTEEQSMDIEPIPPSSLNNSDQFATTTVLVKEEMNTSNETMFKNEMDKSVREMERLETLRPINVITYGNMVAGDFDDESNHRELLDLETASKNKQFVSMMNDNYFGDNIYADYFTPDRVESFDAEKESTFPKENSKDGMYNIWGEPSQKESEFVLPNFIHESYKIAENGVDYSDIGTDEGHMEGEMEKGERDSKVDVLSESRSEEEPPMNICTDEKMPPRGELSGQESNEDMESPWSGMYTDVTPSEPYDLMARESWVSDGSEVDGTEKRENLVEDISYPKTKMYTCAQCGAKSPSLKELRAHKALAHAPPTCSGAKTTYSRMVSTRAIKKEEKPDDSILVAGNLLSLTDSKDSVAMLKVSIEGLIKQETKRRRKDYVCPTCKVDQGSDAAFHAHLKIHPLECLTCGKCFFKRANLALHVKTHLGIKNYKCDVCSKGFITRQKLTEHQNIHTGRAPVKCTMCDETFRRYSNMVQHRDRHHFKKKTKVRDYVCHCGAVFHSRAKLHWHKETHDDKPKACLYCSDKFVHAASLTRHVRRTHNEFYLSERLKGKVDNVPCPVCKQVYLRTNLRAHLLTHSGARPFHCIICNKTFTTKWNLKLHRWTHMSRSAKPYKCHLCKGAFIRHSEFVSHMNAHKSVRPYTCNYCGCQFIRKYNCQRHVREHETAKKYVCKVAECGKSFHRSYYLSEHMKVHSGARPFSCNICGKTSSNKSNHNKHVKIHHAREPVVAEG